MHYPGYLRYFDSTVRELVERGHEVQVAFDKLWKQEEGLIGLEGVVPADRIGTFPRRDDAWSRPAVWIRRLVDYARYLHPDFADAQPLRARVEGTVPRGLRLVTRAPTLGPRGFRLLLRMLHLLEATIPSGKRVEKYLRRLAPDVVVVTPLVASAARQTELVKSARALGIPTVLPVASWDHLTTKGLIRVMPDTVVVWNERQRWEAIQMHGVPEARIVVTGAQPFDRWFDRKPSARREEFCRKVGLPPDRDLILFVGSTASISAPDAEREFVRRWVGALRESGVPRLSEAAVLVRPHPYNSGHWHKRELAGLSDVAIYPNGANPVDEDDRADYFDSIFHSAAVVGINTSAMIEAAVVGRPVHTILADDFADTQAGTLHFRYLMPEHGGFVRVARTLEEHIRQLDATLSDPAPAREELERFVASFVRPAGLEGPATPRVAETIETTARTAVRPERRVARAAVRALVWFPASISAAVSAIASGRARRNLRKLLHRSGGRLLRFAYGSGSFGRRRLARALGRGGNGVAAAAREAEGAARAVDGLAGAPPGSANGAGETDARRAVASSVPGRGDCTPEP